MDAERCPNSAGSQQGGVSAVSNKRWQPGFLGALLSVLLGVGASHQPVIAATVVSFESPVDINAREMEVDDFLRTLFSQINVPVKVDERITGAGNVNGQFTQPAAEIFNDIASSFHLALYYDGAVAHVYDINDVSKSILYVSQKTARRVIDQVEKMDLIDSRNKLERSELGLVVTGVSRFVTEVRDLTSALKPKNGDAIPPMVMQVFPLKYAVAIDRTVTSGGQSITEPGVATILRSLINPDSEGSAPKVTRTPTNPSLEGLLPREMQLMNQNSGAGASTTAEEASRNDIQQAVVVPGIGARIVAYPLTNAIIISDRADRMARYEALINELDVEQEIVEIEATIIDIFRDRARELGFDWRLRRDNSEFSVGSDSSLSPLLPSNLLVTPLEGGAISAVLGNQAQFIGRIRALETQGAARIVSKTHISARPNTEAAISFGDSFLVRTPGSEQGNIFPVQAQTGMFVTPSVFEERGNNRISLRVSIEDGRRTDDQVDQLPVIQGSSIRTEAVITAGESLLIGGMVKEETTNIVTKVPLLGNIPVFGALFRSNTKNTSHVERMFLISPRINLRKTEKIRYDNEVPIINGSEEDIIRSSQSRLQPALAGISQLDALVPLPAPLPRGNAIPGSQTSEAPFDAVEHPDKQQQTSELSLRERVLLMQEGFMAEPPVPMPVPGPGTVDPAYPGGVLNSDLPDIASGWNKVPTVTPNVPADSGPGKSIYEWQQVPSSGGSSAVTVEAVPVKEVPLEDWQEITDASNTDALADESDVERQTSQ